MLAGVVEVKTALALRLQQLRSEGVELSERSVSNLLTQYDILLSVALDTLLERATQLAAQGRAILAIDGLQPDVGHRVLWVFRDTLSGQVLCARSLLSSACAELQCLLVDLAAALPVPVVAVVSDGQHSISQSGGRRPLSWHAASVVPIPLIEGSDAPLVGGGPECKERTQETGAWCEPAGTRRRTATWANRRGCIGIVFSQSLASAAAVRSEATLHLSHP